MSRPYRAVPALKLTLIPMRGFFFRAFIAGNLRVDSCKLVHSLGVR
jgi:hypothetical protein